MSPHPSAPVTRGLVPPPVMNRLIRSMSVFTLVMTIPQVVTVWVASDVRGVSLLSWSAYLVSAMLWFWYGIQEQDRNIYLPCIGWMLLDGAVILGVLVKA